MKLVCAILAVILATSASAQSPAASVKRLLAGGYRIVSVSPITGSYAVLLAKDQDVIICQIGFDPAKVAFTTEKCYPLAD